MLTLTFASSLGTMLRRWVVGSYTSPTSSSSVKGHRKRTLFASHHSLGDRIPALAYLAAKSRQNPRSVMRAQPSSWVPLRRPGKPQVASAGDSLSCMAT